MQSGTSTCKKKRTFSNQIVQYLPHYLATEVADAISRSNRQNLGKRLEQRRELVVYLKEFHCSIRAHLHDCQVLINSNLSCRNLEVQFLRRDCILHREDERES